MEELDLQLLCQEISKKYFHKEFRHQITYNARLKSTGGRYILKTGNYILNLTKRRMKIHKDNISCFIWKMSW